MSACPRTGLRWKLTGPVVQLGEFLISLEHFLDVRLHDVDDLVHLGLRLLEPLLRRDLLRSPGAPNDPIFAAGGRCAQCITRRPGIDNINTARRIAARGFLSIDIHINREERLRDRLR